jgi:hypothetical protein
VLQAARRTARAYTIQPHLPHGQDWSDSDGLSFWYYGQNSGKTIEVSWTNNQAACGDPVQMEAGLER